MALRKWVVALDWVDGDVEDTDESVVFADSAAVAVATAKARWVLSIGTRWPHCRLERAYILSPTTRRRILVE